VAVNLGVEDGSTLTLHCNWLFNDQHTSGGACSVLSNLTRLDAHVFVNFSFEDFAECFPLYVKEDKNGASATFNSISDYIEAQEMVCSVINSLRCQLTRYLITARLGSAIQRI
jgi:hypothetical protein